MPIIARYGGKLIVGDFELKKLEGSPMQGIVAVEFESIEAAERFYNSPEYTKNKHLYFLNRRLGCYCKRIHTTESIKENLPPKSKIGYDFAIGLRPLKT